MANGTPSFDVVVIGGGHAGCEAYAAALRLGARAALVSPDLGALGHQPCNPAVGGLGKGHLVREVVALGGLIGRVTDLAGLQFRTLNRRKGPAVRATRVQTDSARYRAAMATAIQALGGTLLEDRAVALADSGTGHDRRLTGVVLERAGFVATRALVLATGTFLRGLMFIGDRSTPGGREGTRPAIRLADSLAGTGLPLLRLKTGTCPRLDGNSIDISGLEAQHGDEPPPFFDPRTCATTLAQRACYATWTNERTHAVVRDNLARSALYGGGITGVGPRYCPSLETKVARFPDKDRHQIFLEPEDEQGAVIYPAGLSTSLPLEIQEAFVRTIPGLDRARIVRPGYAVEYDAIQPRCLKPSLEVDGLAGLFAAGQLLGTSGYEEAAALGLAAGANAALHARGDAPLVFGRETSYLGVMIDDLTTRGVDEPYRMFTSRAELRLLLREDNADERLAEIGRRTGLVPADRLQAVELKLAQIAEARARLAATRLTPAAATLARLRELGLPAITKPTDLAAVLGRGDVTLGDLAPLAPWIEGLPTAVAARLEVDAKYAGYLDREEARARKLEHAGALVIPEGFEYRGIPGLRTELVEKLCEVRPRSLGQAARIPGITPAALQILEIWLQRERS